MFVLHSYTWAVVFCIITMFCWGSWANTQKLAKKGWRFELFYWDYTIGVLLLTLLLGLTLGSNGTVGRGFLDDLGQASHASIYSALLGGAIFNLANILLVAAIDIAGMSVAFPVGIGLALVLGVLVNYRANIPRAAPRCFLAACFSSCWQSSWTRWPIENSPEAPQASARKDWYFPSRAGITMAFSIASWPRPCIQTSPCQSRASWAPTRPSSCSPSASSSAILSSAFQIHQEAVRWRSGLLCGLFQGRAGHAPHGNPRRHHLGRRHVVQYHCRWLVRRFCDLLWPRPGRHDGRRLLGRLHLERVPQRSQGHERIDWSDVCLLPGGAWR